MAIQEQIHSLPPQGAYTLVGRKSLKKQLLNLNKYSLTKQGKCSERKVKVKGRMTTHRALILLASLRNDMEAET